MLYLSVGNMGGCGVRCCPGSKCAPPQAVGLDAVQVALVRALSVRALYGGMKGTATYHHCGAMRCYAMLCDAMRCHMMPYDAI